MLLRGSRHCNFVLAIFIFRIDDAILKEFFDVLTGQGFRVQGVSPVEESWHERKSKMKVCTRRVMNKFLVIAVAVEVAARTIARTIARAAVTPTAPRFVFSICNRRQFFRQSTGLCRKGGACINRFVYVRLPVECRSRYVSTASWPICVKLSCGVFVVELR